MCIRWNVVGKNFRECFRITVIVIVSIVTLISVAAKGDEIAVIEPVELTEGETFASPSPAEVLLVSGGVVFVGWVRRRKMGDHIPR
ncbi:MAG: hypothetical protein FVQ79_08225 [Planctomycetes bacterium]|nr:hypothetical protein [Planctomycetota bacterium]